VIIGGDIHSSCAERNDPGRNADNLNCAAGACPAGMHACHVLVSPLTRADFRQIRRKSECRY
jgi:hypothetical protein